MAVARINIKNIDYFKFRKLVVDGNRDDYDNCSKEVKALCDIVQTLQFRDEEFDDESDRRRAAEIAAYYKQILISKRIDALDMRIKSGWWGDHKNAYSAERSNRQALKNLLIAKSKDWSQRHGFPKYNEGKISELIEGPGMYVFKHKDHQCFQYVGRADKMFPRCMDKLKNAFEGSSQEPLSALLIISMAADWDFYFIPVGHEDDDEVLRILENDLILKHDSIWPHGLNFRLHIDSLLEVSEFRKSCLRHSWPPDAGNVDPEVDLNKIREQFALNIKVDQEMLKEKQPNKPTSKKGFVQPPWVGATDKSPERPSSEMSSSTESSVKTSSSGETMKAKSPTPQKKKPTRPTSATKRTPVSQRKSATDEIEGPMGEKLERTVSSSTITLEEPTLTDADRENIDPDVFSDEEEKSVSESEPTSDVDSTPKKPIERKKAKPASKAVTRSGGKETKGQRPSSAGRPTSAKARSEGGRLPGRNVASPRTTSRR